MPLQFYHYPPSPPSRSLLMTLKALELEFETKIVNLYAGKHKKPEYLKINPLGKIPALTDGNVNMHESRAIAAYLCNKYAKGEKQSLYPNDPDVRLQVDMMLYVSEWIFDTVIAYLNIRGVLGRGEKTTNEEKLPQVKETLQFVENSLKNRKYLAADHLTISDFFILTPITFLDGAQFSDYDSYPNVVAWIKRMKELPYFDACNAEGMKRFIERYQSLVNLKKETKF